jgi:tetraacyldisaccharide-1-P 4'-kinase
MAAYRVQRMIHTKAAEVGDEVSLLAMLNRVVSQKVTDVSEGHAVTTSGSKRKPIKQ